MQQQHAIGIALVLISILIVILAAQGVTPGDRDATVVLFTLPLGLYMIFTKSRLTYAVQQKAVRKIPSEP
jgi:uncharacterized integral membrane protein